MSRISRYQYSIDKFIQTKSSLISISKHNKPHLDFMYNDFDHLIAICLLSILNNKCKKAKLKFHGYYIASGIDIGLAIAQITDKSDFYRKKLGDRELANFLPELVSIMYQSLSGNIDSLKLNVSVDETLRINQYCINYMSQKMGQLTMTENYECSERINKTDFIDYKFKNPMHKCKYKQYKCVKDEYLFNHVDNKYGTVCKMALIFGWLFGLGEEKAISDLENMGKHMGIIFKIAYDFSNIDNDLEHCKDYTHNIVINKGIKQSVEMFMDSKAILVEGILKLGIWSTTIKEILDLIEQNLDSGLECADIDEKFEFSEFSEFSQVDKLSDKNIKKSVYAKAVKT